MSTALQLRASVAEHFERYWIVWVVGVGALIVGIAIGFALDGGTGFGAATSLTGIGGGEAPRQGGW
ncbi:hypothetical protein M2152_000651 [Microbacteriaceae bacterium SG_E_30_P1]|uniref:Uncharacterized protein n=1 Tax=Antiquaquibacter oligotrophicus TaxID=2880260 RepID=A0ABT6KKS3_9MICO|nr:hypothetical protein [Antiquaquibacter oligotrophicus]MDH6180469.1 hypothetical protein [Antiquaquibacter oligotrophicus]UDF13793.1 hypothetical protein LH407_02760 [Antiquaquibacter oligotrophicus]